jgi:hypothetical protein
MIASADTGFWAVYQKVLRGQEKSVRVVCEQSEWDQMEKENPGAFTLVRGWIRSEAEAERLAREKPMPENQDAAHKSILQ